MNPTNRFLRRTPTRTFRDRRDAGRVLAEELTSYRGKARGARPRTGPRRRSGRLGGRRGAGCAMDVFLVRKLGVPQWPELAMGALASGGGVVMNDSVVSSLHITDEQVRAVIDSETAELKRREHAYRGGPPDRRPARQDRDPGRRRDRHRREHAGRGAGPTRRPTAVDRRRGPGRAAVSVCRELAQEADDVVCATMPDAFEAVGQVYRDFHQVSDDEVRDLLATPTTDGALEGG